MALPLFVVSTVHSEGVLRSGGRLVIGRGLWNKISKEVIITHLTEYSKTAFAI
jgi:hypothetical protein